MPTLAELITEQKEFHGYSYATLEARADHVISRQRWQQLGSNVRITEFPEPATIIAIAAALNINVSEVVLATARSIGIPVEADGSSDLARMLPYSARDLTSDQRNAILALVRSIVTPDRGDRLAAARAVARGEQPIMPPGHGSTPENPKRRTRRNRV
ncbi:hypothetical protein A5717_26280 [Mycolicibacterium porcinum]|uniref:hypothetical protein n=1 Tax=Mycolicibacterium porcinum TaxID=39693 RepID=UPI00080B04EC|nr:hypothetical protein [Mycolicibacterium porcinum]OCB09282.1 hypothetical protein A5717_26280 [Mycolicibacterium porcinum]